jgi:hypothetical protein
MASPFHPQVDEGFSADIKSRDLGSPGGTLLRAQQGANCHRNDPW